MSVKKLEEKIKKVYHEYFKKLGITEEKPIKGDRKFQEYPFIGSKYGKSKKILFVGLSAGTSSKKINEAGNKRIKKTEKELEEEFNSPVRTFQSKRDAIEFKTKEGKIEYQGEKENKNIKYNYPNAHIAGTYFQALYYLRKELEWSKYWSRIKRNTAETCETILKNFEDYENDLPEENPLSYVALTDYYKTIDKKQDNRKHKEGFINEEIEKKLFEKEVLELSPDVIVFQSPDFEKEEYQETIKNIKKELKKKQEKIKIYIGYHPSNQGAIRINKKMLEILKGYVDSDINSASYRNPDVLVGTYEKN